MRFEECLAQQMELHPAMGFQDIIKLCYQAAYGAEHLLADMEKAKTFLYEEYDKTEQKNMPLFEEISAEHVRINLSAWKYRKLPIDILFKIFCLSAKKNNEGDTKVNEYLDLSCRLLKSPDLDAFIEKYRKSGIVPVHHSQQYRDAENPAYRVIKKKYTRLLPIIDAAISAEKSPCIIAIDGRAASGKTSLAHDLAEIIDAGVIHMDDFFLPKELRTEKRLSEAGGNIDYERFAMEVLPKLSEKDSFSYNTFSCSKMALDGRRTVENSDYRIVEGVYSLHPYFGDYADVCVFSDVDSLTQIERIKNRDGEFFADIFSSKWIPMEENYFSKFNIQERCSISL